MWAKTGSMTGVSSLSGYAENPNFPHQVGSKLPFILTDMFPLNVGRFTPTHTQTVIFSIIVNGNSLGQAVARTVIDQIVEALVELRDC